MIYIKSQKNRKKSKVCCVLWVCNWTACLRNGEVREQARTPEWLSAVWNPHIPPTLLLCRPLMFICSAHLGLVTKHLLSPPVCMWAFHTAMTVKERCCPSLLKRSGEAARTSSHVRQGLFSKPELITRLLSGTRDGALSLSRLWLCNWWLWSQISRFEMWSTLPVCSPSSSISDRHEYTLLSTPTKFCSDKNPFSGQQRNALCTCFKS